MIKHKQSHVDHSLSEAQLNYVLTAFADRSAFFIESVTLPTELGTVPCGLHGPATGGAPIADDEVTMEVRGKRPWKSRVVDREPFQTNMLTVIGGPYKDDDGTENPCILYTVYGGPAAPREVDDPGLDEKSKAESEDFWAVNALSPMRMDPKERLEQLTETTRSIGHFIARAISDSGHGDRVGFMLLLFGIDGDDGTSYISSAKRPDMIRLMEEFIVKLRTDGKTVDAQEEVAPS